MVQGVARSQVRDGTRASRFLRTGQEEEVVAVRRDGGGTGSRSSFLRYDRPVRYRNRATPSSRFPPPLGRSRRCVLGTAPSPIPLPVAGDSWLETRRQESKPIGRSPLADGFSISQESSTNRRQRGALSMTRRSGRARLVRRSCKIIDKNPAPANRSSPTIT